MVDRSRRDAIKTIAKGAVYVSPVIATMAAPARLMGQGPSPMMMFMICDFFPVLCMILGGVQQDQPPGYAPPGAPAPEGPFAPPPSAAPPPGAPPPGR